MYASELGTKSAHDHLREHQERGGEDDGHDAAAVHSDGDVGGLTAVHLVALDLLGVLHRDSALGKVDEYYEYEDQDDDEDESYDVPDERPFLADGTERLRHHRARLCDNADEDDERGAVAYADSVMRSPSHMTIVLPAISMMMTLAMVR